MMISARSPLPREDGRAACHRFDEREAEALRARRHVHERERAASSSSRCLPRTWRELHGVAVDVRLDLFF